MTAGVPRKPGQSREELINTNAGIVKSICTDVKKHAPNAVLVVVSNPLDAMVFVAKQVTGFPRERVIGSAGGSDKCDFVRSLGAEAVVDYKAGPVLKQLAEAAPNGIDVYFDNVGGDHLDAALALARKDARFAICGMIEGYNEAHPTCLKFIMRVIAMRIRLKGFIYTDYLGQLGDFYREMGGWLASGQVKSRDTVIDETPAERLLRPDLTPGVEQLPRQAEPDQRRQAVDAAAAGEDAQLDLGKAEYGVAGRHPSLRTRAGTIRPRTPCRCRSARTGDGVRGRGLGTSRG